jgi:molybdenum cofactor cytidylyltransferase
VTIAAVILAAGMSTRMGSVKQLLPWKNGTMLGSTIDLYTKSEVDKIIVVVGYCAAEIIKSLKDKPVKWVINEEYETGMASSLRAGIKALQEEERICLIGLGDTPLLQVSTIKDIIKTHRKYGNKVVAPYYRGKKGHPILITSELYAELLNVQGDVGARTVINAHYDEVYPLEVDDEGVIIDLDTPESYRTYYQKYGR